jgi:DNA-binding NarL/FixJ family response regulator
MKNALCIDLKNDNSKKFDFPNKIEVISLEYKVGENASKLNDELFTDFIKNLNSKLNVILINAISNDYYSNTFVAHVRLSENKNICDVPILLLGDCSFSSVIKRKSAVDKSILLSNRIFFVENYTSLPQSNKDALLDNSEISQFLETYDYLTQDFLNIYTPSNISSTGRHGVSNAWGAYKLGLVLLAQNKTENNLLFKYYAKLHSETNTLDRDELLDFQEKTKDKNVLYIDDEKEIWNSNLKKMMGVSCNLISLNIDYESKDYESICKEIIEHISGKKIHLVILDLRLTKSDSEIERDVSDYLSTHILKRIKEKHKYLSVIIFTASNKAWNQFQMINNHGADGYYIKESPEFLPSKSYSLENTRKLIESIKDGIKRSQQLEKYWIRINKLTEKIESNADLSPEMKSSGVKNLNVVFSLLSSEYSRTNFEKENSEYRAELAFVSLWGILNLINEFFYTKISEQKEVRQKLQGKIPNKIIEENNFKIIVLKENKEVLFVVNDNWKKIHYKAIGKQKRKLKINNLVECNQNDTQHLIYQIGFIILNGLDIDDKRKKELEEDLITLNKFRNTLSIIHGVDLDDPILENQAKHENEGILKKTFSLLELVEKILTSPTKKEESLANKLRKLENKEW